MAKVIAIGQPVNESERRAIAFLRDNLPNDDWMILHNFEMCQGSEIFEIDIAVLAPHALYLVDVKGTKGNIEVCGSKWYPAGRQPFFSPLAKLRSHAKTMATIIRDKNKGLYEINKACVHAAVLLTDDSAVFSDPSGRDSPDVTNFKHCLQYFNEKSRFISGGWLLDIRRFHLQIIKAITGGAKPKNAALVFQNWQVEEKLGGTDRYTEYRAKHVLLGKSGGLARLKVYHTDPYQDEVTRKEEFKKISNAYRAVAHMPSHANILSVKDIIVSEDNDYVALVTEDLPGQALRLYLKKQALALTFDEKLQVMYGVLMALDHAHHYEVIHRNLTPDAILLTESGEPKLTSFDFARVGKDRASTIAAQIVDDLDTVYQAPECYKDPAQASIASDVYSAGLIFYELLTGERPFENTNQMLEADAKFPIKPSEHNKRLLEGFDVWLQSFCEFDPEERHPSAAVALQTLHSLIMPEDNESSAGENKTPTPDNPQQTDMKNLPPDYLLADRFRIQERLGQGGFAVTYKVFDVLGDIVRVMKLVIRDRQSVYERMRAEYQILVNLAEHPHVVKVIWADHLKDQTPYIVFEYVKGIDVSDLIDAGALSLEDSVQILKETADGLSHLHEHGVYHQDIKPNNLIWTEKGVRIIDFNVSVTEKNQDQEGIGGTRRYMPPDLDYTLELDVSDRIDQDLYGLGITFYECMTNNGYPFDTPLPSPGTAPKDPRCCKGCADASESLVKLLMKMIAPRRKDRFASVEELLKALGEVKTYRVPISKEGDKNRRDSKEKIKLTSGKDNTNPFVTHLLTLYSQSQLSNAGTRGLDEIGKRTYVPTFLDENLKPELLQGTFNLVIISGNAGDGKTAFIQQVEDYAVSKGAELKRGANGALFKLKGHTYRSNYDGSQDEGDERNDVVLKNFFAPFAGKDKSKWPKKETRLIAVNEGRLVDFFQENENEYPLLVQEIQRGLKGASAREGIVIINLNLRSIVSPSGEGGRSIMEHLLERMTQPGNWQACEKCDIRSKCYALYNARTFQDPVAGPKVMERLKLLYTVTHLRAKLHITMRDIRSALAYMLTGNYDYDEINQLYLSSGAEIAGRILDGFYFNSWLGGSEGSQDRLVSLLREIDVAEVSNPDLDRKLSFFNPKTLTANRFLLTDRSAYDDEMLDKLFNQLPQARSQKEGFSKARVQIYRNYLSYLRRRHYFERRDDGWKEMLPYGNIEKYMEILRQAGQDCTEEVPALLQAINRGEGLRDAQGAGGRDADAPIRGLALRVRQIEKGTIRSYRLFRSEYFNLSTDCAASEHPFLERFPQTLFLKYDSGDSHAAKLRINLDLYEILMRLKDGYRPSVEAQEGFYLSLTVFKNILSASPYQEVLLTDNDLVFYRVRRDEQGILHMERLGQEAKAWA